MNITIKINLKNTIEIKILNFTKFFIKFFHNKSIID